jgi:hypothetical protein
MHEKFFFVHLFCLFCFVVCALQKRRERVFLLSLFLCVARRNEKEEEEEEEEEEESLRDDAREGARKPPLREEKREREKEQSKNGKFRYVSI